MASNTTKRSFNEFESNQKDVIHSKNKKVKLNEHKSTDTNTKRQRQSSKQADIDYFAVKFSEPNDFDHSKSHCLEFRKLFYKIHENALYAIIQKELQNWYDSKAQKKQSSNKIEGQTENGAIDIHLFHNRHILKNTGFCNIYFENKSDASFILQLSKEKKLKYKNHTNLHCQWKNTNEKDRDSYSEIYQTDITLKSQTKMIKISNLHWKTTVFHIRNIFIALGSEFEPQWIKILEDKNGYPKNICVVQLGEAANVVSAIDRFTKDKCTVLGRHLRFEYSKYEYLGPLFLKFNLKNIALAGVSNKVLFTNLRQNVRVSHIRKFLMGYECHGVTDIYLFQNQNRVCSGKCFVTFDTSENAQKCIDCAQFKPLWNRTVVIEYGYCDKNERIENLQLRDRTNKLIIKNLAWDTKEKEIKRFFGEKIASEISEIYFNVATNGFPKGSAFLTFNSNEIASKAYDKSNGKQLKNRKVKLDFAKPYNPDRNDDYNHDY